MWAVLRAALPLLVLGGCATHNGDERDAGVDPSSDGGDARVASDGAWSFPDASGTPWNGYATSVCEIHGSHYAWVAARRTLPECPPSVDGPLVAFNLYVEPEEEVTYRIGTGYEETGAALACPPGPVGDLEGCSSLTGALLLESWPPREAEPARVRFAFEDAEGDRYAGTLSVEALCPPHVEC